MKNKKTIVAIIAIVLVAVVGVTFAYFQSTAQFENLFNVGIYKVTTTEVFESPDNWAPGQEIPKTITTTNEGTIPAAVRVSYTEQWLDGDTDITSSIPEGTVTVNLDNTSDWTKEGNYYYYNYILEPEDTTSSFMKSVTLSSSINGITCTASQDGLTQSCESNSPIQGATYKLTITKETVQTDSYQEVWNTNVEITEKTDNAIRILSGEKGNLQNGDMVGIGNTEDFYVISSDNSPNGKTILLAKYNLLVGNIVDEYQGVTGTIPTNTQGYGLQNIDAKGYCSDWQGATSFSDTIYWMDNDNIASDYSENNTIYFDGYNYKYLSNNEIAYPYVYDENSNLYQYISGQNGYVNRLIEMGAPSTITGRLITYEEALLITEDILDTYSFWTGFVNSYEQVANFIGMDHSALFINSVHYNENTYYGVRPIIEVYTKDIN